MIIPATEGMKTILDACLVHKVKRLIVTSSLATIIGGVWKRDTGDNHYTEADVAPPEGADGYGRSKIAQEKVIRDFIKERQIGNLEIVTLHPTMVIGPTLTSERVSTPEGISKFMNRSIPGVPEMCVPSVDVRDVAEAHVRALFAKDLHGKRIILNKASMTMIDLANYLDEEFRQYGYNVQTRRIGYCPLKIASYFDTQVKTILPMIGVNLTADNKLSTQLLGIDYSRWTLKESTVALGYSLIDKGLVPDKRPGAAAKK
jgi:dihydroflavonol-4-reductase